MYWQEPSLPTLSVHKKMRKAAPEFSEILDLQVAQFLAAKSVVQEYCQDCTVSHAFQSGAVRGFWRCTGLFIAQCRSLALQVFDARALDSTDWVMSRGIDVSEIFKQGGADIRRRMAPPESC